MNKSEIRYPDTAALKTAVLRFAANSEACFILDSNERAAAMDESEYELLAGFGLLHTYSGTTAQKLRDCSKRSTWKFIQMQYGAFGQSESLIAEPRLLLYVLRGETVLHIVNNGIRADEFQIALQAIAAATGSGEVYKPGKVHFRPLVSESLYRARVEQIRQDIIDGKYYELNYCIPFQADYKGQNMAALFGRLNQMTESPFSAYVCMPGYNLVCSSPERFLKKKGKRLLSQPIKGTNRKLEGEANAAQLKSLSEDEKERAENVMIVDLVRNDLARVCKPGSVRVDELCGAYAYKSVNHLVSSISGEISDDKDLADILEALFPMGSMTGAPKIEVMKHIEKYEAGPRGIYSGCLGYISPEGDMDLNVLIRTLVYDESANRMTFHVGSAITYDSIPENEYQECLLKGSRLCAVFGE